MVSIFNPSKKAGTFSDKADRVSGDNVFICVVWTVVCGANGSGERNSPGFGTRVFCSDLGTV